MFEVGAEAKEDFEEGEKDRLTFFPVLNETPALTDSLHDSTPPRPCSQRQDCSDLRVIMQELHPEEKVLQHKSVGWPKKTHCINTNTTPLHPTNIHSSNYVVQREGFQ